MESLQRRGKYMPSKTKKQQRAMRAAAAGKSTLGISKSVGRKYVKADKNKAKNKTKRYA